MPLMSGYGVQRQAHPTVRFNYLDVQYFYVRISSEQIKHTWHDVCVVRNNYPKVHPTTCPPPTHVAGHRRTHGCARAAPSF